MIQRFKIEGKRISAEELAGLLKGHEVVEIGGKKVKMDDSKRKEVRYLTKSREKSR
jgi:hypothetical protein